MKPVHDPTNRNCSCTSCMYKSASEHPSIRRFLVDGSRIDKLYLGKYIPLRERKLLNKLVRTRAVYDDLRNQLLSESEASMKEKPNLKPRKHQVQVRTRPKDLKGKRSSAIIELVDMVDKGKISGPITASECCNCCVCGSKTIHAHHEYSEMRRHKHGHGRGRGGVDAMSRTSSMVKRKIGEAKRGIVTYGRNYAHRMSRTSMMMRQLRESKRAAARTRGVGLTLSRTSMMIKNKMGEIKRNVRSKAKSIMSEPCTCTSQLTGEMKRRSQEVARRLRPRVQLGEQTMFEGVLSKKQSKPAPPTLEITQVVKREHRRGRVLREPYQKIKRSKARLIEHVGEGARRLRESKTKIKKHIEAEARKSMEKIRDAKERVKENIKTAVKKSMQELDFPIKKDSIVKFKEKIKTRKQSHDYECEHECIPGECVPEECFKIIKLTRVRRAKKGKVGKDAAGVEENIGITTNVSEMGVQAQRKGVPEKLETEEVVVKTETQQVEQKGGVVKTVVEKRQKIEYKKKGAIPEPRINIDIGSKKRSVEVKVKTDKLKEKIPTKTKSVKSMTGLPPVPSKQLPRVPSGPELKKTEQKQRDEVATSVVLKTTKRRRTEYRNVDKNLGKLEPGAPKGRQPAKTSSPFSFSLEFRKGKEGKQPIQRQIYVKKKEKTHGTTTKADQEIHHGSQMKLKQSKRDVQVGSHALKRCFCTLKLKGKGYKPKPRPPIPITTGTQSQTSKFDESNIEERVQTKPIKARGMACTTCPSEECTPSDCIRLNKNRHHGVGTKKESRSISSLASRSVSTSSKSVVARPPQQERKQKVEKLSSEQARPPQQERKQKVEKLSSEQAIKPEIEGDQGEGKQAVRISSSFSFNIEFYKENPTEEPVLSTHEDVTKRINKKSGGTYKRKHLRHKHSQISNLTGKSKYTLTKHSLRRCFCTLKLGKANKKKVKPELVNAGSSTSRQKMQFTQGDLVSVNKGIATDRKKKYQLLPHECEPGICVPGECDPYACLELMKKRQIKHSHKYSNTDMHPMVGRHSNTDNRKAKSTSSFTSRSRPKKVKRVQSTMGTSETYHRDTGKTSRPIKTTHSSPNRQIVRISSSFSFDIEFYKNSPSPQADVVDIPLKSTPQSSEAITQSHFRKDRGYQDKKIKKHQKSTSILIKKKNKGSFIAPMKRCFCTLKLQTKDKKENINEKVTIGTETPVEQGIELKNVMLTKGTKTKQDKHKYGYVLEPYECEPGICVPGECDPYRCLERIQMRQLKESGTATDKAKMKSATSVTQGRKFKSKGALVRSKLRGQKVSTTTQKTKITPRFHPEPELKPQRQVVRIGSTFSFDVEFHKDKSQSLSKKDDSLSKITNARPVKKMKNRGAKPREAISSHHDTQISIPKAHKAAGIRPMLKRCFCTLKLQDNNKKPIKPKVVAVSRVTVAKTKNILNNNEIFAPTKSIADGNWATASYNFRSSSVSKSSIVFRYKEMKSYFRKKDLDTMSYTLSKNILRSSPCNVFAQSNFILPTFYTKVNEKYAYSENCIIRFSNNEKRRLKKRKSLVKLQPACLKSQKSSNFSEPQSQYTRVTQLKRQNYYTMNLQIPEPRKKYKLKPYECEPGVCVPDECDPYECQKLIKKRLMKNTAKMSGTNIRSKSISSSTGHSVSSSKKLQARQHREPRVVEKKVPAGGMTFKTLPSRSHKQAVRVGSSFSFNIEFSKGRSEGRSVPAKEYTPRPTSISHKRTKPPRKKIKEQGTRGHGMNYRDQDSQSATETVNKGSGVKPMMQRCFCTLKLQKKGKNQRNLRQKAAQQALDRGTVTPTNTMTEFIASRTMMNTGQNTATHKLLPYECEPLICVPGECDPYECLERIKKRNKRRKDFGTGAMRYKTSTGSMTGRNQYRNQGKQVQSKFKTKQTKSRASSESGSSRVVKYQERPSKQAVRIGSSFSFNVEFFKENAQSQRPAVQFEPQRIVKTSTDIVQAPKEKNRKKKLKDSSSQEYLHKRNLKERGSQDHKLIHNRDAQAGNMATQGKSTMTTTFLKRCFCTAKLHGKQKPNIIPVQNKSSQAENKQPFLERCFCVMQKLRGAKIQKMPKIKQPEQPKVYVHAETETSKEPVKDRKLVIRNLKSPKYELEPYECEPGVCIPGECNPYECEKLIKARNMKLQTREVFTEKPRTRSISSNFSSQTSKARRTQSNFRTTSSTTKPRPSHIVKEIEPVRHLSSDRQVVRIGSNFSFSVEFYKDRTPNTAEVQAAAKAIRQKPHLESKKKAVATGSDPQTPDRRDRGSMGSNETLNQESQANKAKTRDHGSGFGPALKRCFCTLKLQKGKKPAIVSATHGTETMKEMPTLQTRGIGTGKHWKLKPYECEPGVCVPYQCDPYECEKLIKKRLLKETAVMTKRNDKHLGYKLLPYECEPGVCIPGQCNPYECEKLIKLRNMKHRHSGTSTKRYRRKSVASDIRSITSSKARKAQYKRRKVQKRSQSVSSRRPYSRPYSRKSLDTSTRQSVRIGSGFSFDIEFYKNKSNTNNADLRLVPVKQKLKPTRSTSSSAYQRLPMTKSRKMQYRKGLRDTDSQIVGRKMRNTGVNPFLKRCFCTLKLQKSGEVVSNPKVISRAARDKNVYLATLLPYECEPGVCIPGKCDPYECQKRIQRRLMRSESSETERAKHDSATSSGGGARYRDSTSQSHSGQRKQKNAYAKAMRGHEPRTRQDANVRPVEYSSSSSSRQAVRIGSSFQFDVEFFKDRSPKFAPKENYVEARRRIQHISPKPVHNVTTKPKHAKTRSRSVTSSDRRIRHNQLQTGSRTESKSTGFGPRLKRCFCTLALHKKKTPPETRTKSTLRNDDLSDLYSFSRNVGVGTRKKYGNLKPYECEPGVCVPGSCDPYECYERIKRRLKDSGTTTVSPSKKYASSGPRNAKYRSANTQFMKEKQRRGKAMHTMANFQERIPVPKAPKVTRVAGDSNRQAVRIGSNFSFSVEFYKDRPSVKIPKNVYKVKDVEVRPSKPHIRKLNKADKTSYARKKYRSRPSYAGKSALDEECQADCITLASKGTNVGAFFKRCFCTLNLHKNNKYVNQKNRIEKSKDKRPKGKPQPVENVHAAMVQTQDKYTKRNKRYPLLPYECEPNVCIPGQCDPYECEERIRRRNIRRQSRRIGTHRRSSQVSVGSMASRLVPRSSRRVQSGERRARYATRPSQVPKFVEEPRFAHMFEEMRSGVKIGSNVSFNIEFYKDKSQIPTYEGSKRYEDYKPPKQVKIKHRDVNRKSTFSESRPKAMHRGIGGKYEKRTSAAQASAASMVNKGAGVNNMLKRCFCTLKLHKNPPKGVIVNRLAIENENPPFRHIKKDKKKQSRSILKNNLYNGHNTMQEIKSKHNNKYSINQNDYHTRSYSHPITDCADNCKEMTTIYPYIPNKFNKNISNTFLLHNMESDQLVSARKRRLLNNIYIKKRPEHGGKGKQNHKSGKQAELNSKVQNKSDIICHKSGRMQYIKSFLYQLLPGIFSKNHATSPLEEKIIDKSKIQRKMIKNEKNIKMLKQDVLKTSKSERHPAKGLTTPKKSISLKVTKAPDIKRRNRDYVINYQNKKKYSRYQSGDTGQVPPVRPTDREFKLVYPEYNSKGITYSQVIRDTKKMYSRSPYESTKIVQMSLIRNKNNNTGKKLKSASTTTNTNKKITSRSKGIVTENLETKSKILQQCLRFINGDKKTNNNLSRLSTKSIKPTNTLKDKDLSHMHEMKCPCFTKRKKSMLSSGDVLSTQAIKKGPKGKKQETKKGKKVGFDEASINKHETKKRRAAGDAPNKPQSPCPYYAAYLDKSKQTSSTEKEPSPKEDTSKKKITSFKKSKPDKKITDKETKKLPKTVDVKHKQQYSSGYHKGKFMGAKLTIIGKREPTSSPVSSSKACVCGSRICVQETRKMVALKTTKGGKGRKSKKAEIPCICGSEPCAEELKKQKKNIGLKQKKVDLKKRAAELERKSRVCKCHEEMERRKYLQQKKIEDEKNQKIYLAKLQKQFKAEDERRKKERAREDKLKEKQLKKFKQSGDGMLAAESFLDVLKLGGTASIDMARCGARAILHPKHTALSMKELARHPSRAFSAVEAAISSSGVVSTIRRVRARCAAMKRIQRIKEKLEGNPITRYLLYMCSKDPKKRIGPKGKRMMRRREPIDFECSLFMASLRRRPCLAVYYSCPWFYPHCLSMLNLWKQFTDVMLFLIAVTVWSPCIVLMEIFRAFVCCVFCTG